MKDSFETEELDVLQADMDDESPQVLAHVAKELLEAGALDAHLCPLTMKKGRPGTRIEVLCRPEDRDRFVRLLLVETSTLGVKARHVQRYALPRRFGQISVSGQTVQVKIASLDGEDIRATPELEDCRKVARATGQPLRDVLDAARAEARALLRARE